MSNLFSDLKSILHLILVSKNVLLRKVFIFLDLLSLTFVSQVYINVRDWKSFQTPILKLLELFGRWKFDRLCILSYFLISEDILAVLPPLKRGCKKIDVVHITMLFTIINREIIFIMCLEGSKYHSTSKQLPIHGQDSLKIIKFFICY